MVLAVEVSATAVLRDIAPRPCQDSNSTSATRVFNHLNLNVSSSGSRIPHTTDNECSKIDTTSQSEANKCVYSSVTDQMQGDSVHVSQEVLCKETLDVTAASATTATILVQISNGCCNVGSTGVPSLHASSVYRLSLARSSTVADTCFFADSNHTCDELCFFCALFARGEPNMIPLSGVLRRSCT